MGCREEICLASWVYNILLYYHELTLVLGIFSGGIQNLTFIWSLKLLVYKVRDLALQLLRVVLDARILPTGVLLIHELFNTSSTRSSCQERSDPKLKTTHVRTSSVSKLVCSSSAYKTTNLLDTTVSTQRQYQ